MKYLSFGILLCGMAAWAQPVIRSQNPAVNSASFRTPGLSASGIAQGSLFMIKGTGLGPDPWVQATTFPLETTLGGSSVAVTIGGTSVQALVVLAWSSQINAVLPSTAPTGTGTFTVTYNGQTSNQAPITVVPAAFGIYTYNGWGSGQAIATFPDYRYNTIIQAFHPGDTGVLWGTGLGAISGDDAAPPPVGNLPTPIKLHVGNAIATVIYQGRSGCCSGLDQINFVVPSGVSGCHVPIAVEIGGEVGNIATIAITTSGQTCTDSVMGQDLVDNLASGQTVDFGYIRLESNLARFNVGSGDQDFGTATFSEFTPATAGNAQYGVSSGGCVTMECSPVTGCHSAGGVNFLSDQTSGQLDAGSSLMVDGQGKKVPMTCSGGWCFGMLSQNGGRDLWSVLPYTVSGQGGSKVGPFSATDMTSVANVMFTDYTLNQITTVPRNRDFTLKWTGGDPQLQNGQMTIGGYSMSSDYTQVMWLQCTAPLADQQFTIPAWVLSTLPVSGTFQNGSATFPIGLLWIGQYNVPVTFSATGLDRGILTDGFFNGLGVYFQ